MQPASDTPVYFAALPLYSANLAVECMARVDRWYDSLPEKREYQRSKRNRKLYWGLPNDSSPFDVGVLGLSDQDALARAAMNIFHHLGQRILTMTVQDDFGWQPVAANGDTSSQQDAIIASSVLEHEKRDKRLGRVVRATAEAALLDGSCWFTVRWDPRAGPIYEQLPDTGTLLYEGRLQVTRHSFFRVTCAQDREDSNHDWVIITERVNKWDLAARHPDLAKRILNSPHDHQRVVDWQRTARGAADMDSRHRDMIAIYTLLHRPTSACPRGRVTTILDSQTVIFDGESPYGDRLPAYRVAPADMLDSPDGISPLTDISGLQDLLNEMVSIAATNARNNGLTPILVPSASNVQPMQLAGGNYISYDGGQEMKPEALNLVGTSPEIMKLAQWLSESMTTLVGLNSVALGQNTPDLSGAAMALLDSKALQFATLFIASYRQAVEDMGTGIVDCYKRFAKAPRALEVVVGTARRYMLKEFTGEQLGDISRVTVEARSPLLDTVAGKMDMLDKFLERGVLKGEDAARAALAVYTGGNLDPAILPAQHEQQLLDRENDSLSRGELPIMFLTDDHVRHIQHHRAVVSSPELRADPNIGNAVRQHIDEHLSALQQVNPGLLAALGIQAVPPPPLPPPLPMPGGPPPPGPAAPPPPGGPGADVQPPPPEQPSLPSMPTNPSTGEQAPLPPVAAQ